MKVTGFGDIVRFREFYLEKKEGTHAFCRFSFVSYQFDNYSNYMNNTVKIVEDDRYLMIGKISSIEYQMGNSENIITVTVNSFSNENDQIRKTRVFHKQGQKYEDIIEQLSELGNFQIDVSKEINEMECNIPVVQLNETDFEFLKRIAAKGYNNNLYIESSYDGKKYFIGSKSDAEKKISRNEISTLVIGEKNNKKVIRFTIAGDVNGLELRQYADVGKRIIVNNETYVLKELYVRRIDCVYRYECVAEKATNNVYSQENLYKQFTAKVVDNQDEENFGRVRLDFTNNEIEDKTSSEKMWFDILTPYTANDGGFVFIPDVEDIVEVLWNGSSFMIVGCKRKNALSEKYQDVNLKQIGNLYGKNICFSEEALEITSNSTSVNVTDNKIEINVNNSKITVTEEDILVETSGSNVVLNNDIIVGTSKMHIDANEMENNIKNKYTCESKNIGINASSIVNIEGGSKVSIN